MDVQAEHDQAAAAMRDRMRTACAQMADAASTFKDALVSCGFAPDAAQELVVVWMDRMMERWADDPCDM